MHCSASARKGRVGKIVSNGVKDLARSVSARAPAVRTHDSWVEVVEFHTLPLDEKFSWGLVENAVSRLRQRLLASPRAYNSGQY